MKGTTMEQNEPNRLTVMYRWSDSFDAWHYAHKYYLKPEDKERLFPVDLRALEQLGRSLDNLDISDQLHDGENMPGCTIYYKDLGLEKVLPARLVAAGLLAMVAYRQERQQELTPEEFQAALQLNAWLRGYEKKLQTKRRNLKQELQKQLACGDTFLRDYEVEAEIEIYLSDDDPFCTAPTPDLHDWDCDISLMCRLQLPDQFDEDTDYNDHPDRGKCCNPIFNEPHCWLFHDLTAHHGVPIKHLCRIGRVWGEVMVRHQNTENVTSL